MVKLTAFFILILLVSGCANTSSHVITGQVRAATSPADIVVYRLPPKNYTEIAIVSANNSGSLIINEQDKTNYVIGLLKNEAAALGANAIILTTLGDQPMNIPITTHNGTNTSTANVTGFLKVAEALAVYVESNK